MGFKRYVSLALIIVLIMGAVPAHAQKTSSDILKEGLLGAGAGAVGGAASGAKGKDLWKGALAGAGVNVVGGALLDSISGEKVRSADSVDSMSSRDAYGSGYQDGHDYGYKAGFTEGYQDGVKDAAAREPSKEISGSADKTTDQIKEDVRREMGLGPEPGEKKEDVPWWKASWRSFLNRFRKE